jgi:hypothetical protein
MSFFSQTIPYSLNQMNQTIVLTLKRKMCTKCKYITRNMIYVITESETTDECPHFRCSTVQLYVWHFSPQPRQ